MLARRQVCRRTARKMIGVVADGEAVSFWHPLLVPNLLRLRVHWAPGIPHALTGGGDCKTRTHRAAGIIFVVPDK